MNFPKLSSTKAKALVEEELNQREIDFDLNNSADQTHDGGNQLKVTPIGSSIKNSSTKSSKLLKDDNRGLMSPKHMVNTNDLLVSYEKHAAEYVSKMNSKSQRTAGKMNVSGQSGSTNMKNYMNYQVEEEENTPNVRSMKKPNPTLAPIQNKPMNVPDINGKIRSANLEAMIPSVDELRKRRGDLIPLKHNVNSKMNNSFDSQEN